MPKEITLNILSIFEGAKVFAIRGGVSVMDKNKAIIISRDTEFVKLV